MGVKKGLKPRERTWCGSQQRNGAERGGNSAPPPLPVSPAGSLHLHMA